MARSEFSVSVKKQAYARCLIDGKPHCEVSWAGKVCGKLILGTPEYDHIKPDGLQGEPTFENCQVACGACHTVKTHQHDRPIMQKADNQKKAHAGIKRQSQPIPVRKALKTIKEKGSSHQAYLQRMAEKGKPVPQRRAT
jgi:hypothetical protein